MAQANMVSRPTFDDLHDDCIFNVIDELKELQLQTFRSTHILNFSMVNKRVRELCRGVMFRRKEIRLTNWANQTTPEDFRLLATTPYLTPSVFKLTACLPPQTTTIENDLLCREFINAVTSMPKLREIYVSFFWYDENLGFLASRFRSIFTELKPTFQNINSLHLDNPGDSGFLVRSCPNLAILTLNQPNRKWVPTLQALHLTKALRELRILGRCDEDFEHLEVLIPLVPTTVQHLLIASAVDRIFFAEHLNMLERLTQLQTLSVLPMDWYLYRPGAPRLNHQVLLKMIFERISSLHTIKTIGLELLTWNCVRTSDGKVESVKCCEDE